MKRNLLFCREPGSNWFRAAVRPLLVVGILGSSTPYSFADGPFTIPLEVVNVGTSSANPVYKLGINIGLGGGAPKLYEFDTGGSGFFAAYKYDTNTNKNETPWWNSSSFTSSGQAIDQKYSSGIKYDATIVSTSVQIYGSGNSDATPLASVNANVGQIDTASGDKVTDWDYDLKHGTAPLYQNFYGDFGAGLSFKAGKSPDPSGLGLYSILPQLSAAGGLANGFIVRMGGTYLNPTATLQIGITDADRAAFPMKVSMTAEPTSATSQFPNSLESTYEQDLFQSALDLGGKPSDTTNTGVDTVTDSGAPTTEIHPYPTVSVPTDSIDSVLLSATDAVTGQPDTLLQYNAGDLEGYNQVNINNKVNDNSDGEGYINTGLNLFFQNEVLYDVQNGQIDFLPNLIPIPEPGNWGELFFAGIFAAFAGRWMWRRIAS